MVRRRRDEAAQVVDVVIDIAVMVGVAVLVLVGFATSYHTLLDLAVTPGGYPRWLAPAVPLSFDLGIVVLSLKVAQAAREGRHALVLRSLVIALSAVTVLANASAVPGTAAGLLHAVPPAMFVICFESVVIGVRRRALQARDAWPEPIPVQPPLHWLLAPRATWTRWRHAVLHGTVRDDFAVPGERAETSPARLVGGHRTVEADTGDAAAPIEVEGVGSRSRDAVVVAALQQDRELSSAALRERLAEEGFVLSLRSVQRLRATMLGSNVE